MNAAALPVWVPESPELPEASLVLPKGSLVITGPTASGKSAVAMVLARQLGAEIVSVDSMQVYRGLDLGTAKPSRGDRSCVPHHVVDEVPLDQGFSVAQFLTRVRQVLDDLARRRVRPVFCGGSGLYLRALVMGLDTGPAPDPKERARMEVTPLAELVEALQQADPAACDRVDRQNRRRVIRALEKAAAGGRGPLRGSLAVAPALGVRVFCLRRKATDLRRRIELRVEDMFARGLVEETRQLLDRGLEGNRTAMQSIGYRQVVEHLRGVRDLASTVALVKQKTWQYARRQMTWFRHQLPVVWMEVGEDEAPEQIADRIRLQAAGI
jgi:tRNA dimethylallyltransferase